MKKMKKTIVFVIVSLVSLGAFAQNRMPKGRAGSAAGIQIPMQAEKWEFTPGKVEFISHKSIPALKILPDAGEVLLKDVTFSDGIIEFDIEPVDPPFTGIYFRMQDTNESEYVYLRTGSAGKPMAMDAVQYVPIIKGVNLWNLLGHYQGPALIKNNEWNHIKLVVSGKQMRVYVNDLSSPALHITRLEGDTRQGSLAFDGSSIIANLTVKPNATEGLVPTEGVDPTYNDPRYIRQWAVSQPMPLPKGRELTDDDLPKPDAKWEYIEAERRGLVNLSRQFGKSETRQIVWLKVKMVAASEQKRQLQFGFNGEVWVFLNGQIAYVDKNFYRQPIMKEPEGRVSLENTSISLPLKAGENELIIGIAITNIFGWGIVARLENLEGLTFSKL
jgi:hypothetical protein